MSCAVTYSFRKTGLFLLLSLLSTFLYAAEMPDHVPGRLLAIPKQGADAARVAATLAGHRAKIHHQIASLGIQVLDVPEESSAPVIESLKNSGLFEIVERDYYAHTAAATTVVPNDTSYSNQWYLPQISAPQAWAISTGSASVVVAVVDSGVDGAHHDLASKLAPGWNFLTSSSTTTDALGHGTAVAGVVAAASNNGAGIAGVSWNSRIMPLVVVDTTGYASYSNIAAAIQYAADNGASVVNVSLGGTSSSSVLQSAVDYAWSKNVVVFAAAMNDSNTSPSYPAACNHAVAVSATDSTDALATYSNYGSWIALSAPGSNIFTTTVGGGYGYWYGTSFASPIATGVAALALAVNPTLTAPALVTLLEQNSDDLGAAGFDSYFGWGRVNAFKAVTAAQPHPVVTTAPLTASLTAGQAQQFTATVTGTTNTAVTWSLNPAVGSISSTGLYTAPASFAQTQTVTVIATGTGGITASSTVTLTPITLSLSPKTASLSAGQTQQFTATVTGSANTIVTWSISPQVGTISSLGLYTAPTTVSSAQTVTVTASGASGVAGSSTVSIAPTVTSNAGTSFTPIRVNAGGASYTDTTGLTWAADYGFTGGNTWFNAGTVPNNPAPVVYQTCRYGTFSYNFTLPNGNYTVALKFAEPSLSGAGKRLFNVALNGTTILNNFDVYAAAGGMMIAVDRSFPVTVTNGQVNLQFQQGPADWPMVSGIQIVQAAQAVFTPIRVNASGPAYTDPVGQIWSADTDYSGGNTWSTQSNITGTTTPTLYQTCRWGAFSYAFNVPNGNYVLNLKFAEISLTGAGQRQFNVSLNGWRVLNNFDIYAAAGGAMIAVDKSFPVTVTNGQINLQFAQGAVNWPLVSAIEIVSANVTTLPPSTILVNASGPAYTDSKGQQWQADIGYTGGNTWSNTGKITGTADPTLYQTCRWGDFTYGFLVPNGSYTVTLKFAEISRTAAGQRQFNVAINAATVLTNFDIIAAAGAPMTAIDKTFQVTVTNGQIVLEFTTGNADLPLVNAIDIAPAAAKTSTNQIVLPPGDTLRGTRERR